MGGQVYDRESIEKMYGKGGENYPGRSSYQAVLRHATDSPAAMQCILQPHPIAHRCVSARMPPKLSHA